MTTHLAPLAHRIDEHPDYCAYLLRAYLNKHADLTLNDLAARLRCSPDRLLLLWHCGRPEAHWETDVDSDRVVRRL
jgi:hypothetical protein